VFVDVECHGWREGRYKEPVPELGFQNLVAALLAKAIVVGKSRE
jgi:hypothetical protein